LPFLDQRLFFFLFRVEFPQRSFDSNRVLPFQVTWVGSSLFKVVKKLLSDAGPSKEFNASVFPSGEGDRFFLEVRPLVGLEVFLVVV